MQTAAHFSEALVMELPRENRNPVTKKLSKILASAGNLLLYRQRIIPDIRKSHRVLACASSGVLSRNRVAASAHFDSPTAAINSVAPHERDAC